MTDSDYFDMLSSSGKEKTTESGQIVAIDEPLL